MAKKIPEETRQAIINDYVNNVSIPEIAKKYNINSSTVYLIKKQYNIPNRFISIDDYDDNTINNIINDYKNGVMLIDMCIKYDISEYKLYKVLQNNNIALSKYTKLTKEQEQEIVQMYLDGYRIQDILKKYNISRSVLKRLMDTYNIPKRNEMAKKYKITDKKIINSIINDYINSNLLVTEICEKYNIDHCSLNTLVTKNNISTRKSIKRKNCADSDIINDYNNGIKIADIISKYNTSKTTIYSILKRNNIKLNRYK